LIKQAEWFAEMTRGYDRDPEYQAEYMKLIFGEELGDLMGQQHISQAELARRIGTSRAYITRIFRSDFNPTLETLAKLAIALDARIAIHLHPNETEVRWLEVPKALGMARARSKPAATAQANNPVVSDKPRIRKRERVGIRGILA
jgi:transcriptional regulator with XRE-family HTH domain